MSLDIVRRIRGNLHGSIHVSDLEDAVISHPIFQRLRRIKQTAMLHYVFPGATHTRFEHSLGVMRLASKAWEALSGNQRRLEQSYYSKKKNPTNIEYGDLEPAFKASSEIFSNDYHHQVLRLSGLLHDIGHPPFSHSGELLLPSFEKILEENQTIPQYIRDLLERYKKRGSKVSHEVYSILLVHQIFMDLKNSHPELAEIIDPRDIIAVIWPEFGLNPGSPLEVHQSHQLCHELISGELDVDRMDYLLRDSKECGVVYGIFDAPRILDGLAFYHSSHDNRLHIALRFSALSAFEDYLRARHSMYLQLYFHKTSVATEAMFQALICQLDDYKLPASINSYWEIDEYNIETYLLRGAKDKLSKKEYIEFEHDLRDLTRYRRLWKREYEETSRDPIDESKAQEIANALIRSGKKATVISSRNVLTKLKSRSKDDSSTNTLKIVKRNEFDVPEIVPIEDHSRLAGSKEMIHIVRVYRSL